MPMEDPGHLGHFFRVAREDNGLGGYVVGGLSVRLVDQKAVRIADDPI
jgi:hypothetical protein